MHATVLLERAAETLPGATPLAHHCETFQPVCSHQHRMLAQSLMRGDELTRMTLVSLSTHVNTSTSPLPLEAVQIDVQYAKNNRGDKVDNRLLAHSKTIHKCPLLHMGIHMWAKLNPKDGPAPFRWCDIVSGDWCGLSNYCMFM